MSIKVESRNDWWVSIKSHVLPLTSANIKTPIHAKTSKDYPKTTLNEMLLATVIIKMMNHSKLL